LKDVLDFVDSGHDLVIAANANASDFIRNVASECGVDFEDVSFALPRYIYRAKFRFNLMVMHKFLDIFEKFIEVPT